MNTESMTIFPDKGNELNDAVMEDAATSDGMTPAPETTPQTQSLTVWNEPELARGHEVMAVPAVPDTTVAEQLVNAGNEEADLDRRPS